PMSPEEMQRAMQFLLNQQAQFAADQAKFAADIAKNEARWTERFDRLSDGLVGLTAIVGQVVTAQLRTDEHLREMDARLTRHIEAVESHLNTVESHLNVVIEMFERHLREDHGLPPPS